MVDNELIMLYMGGLHFCGNFNNNSSCCTYTTNCQTARVRQNLE